MIMAIHLIFYNQYQIKIISFKFSSKHPHETFDN